MVNIYEKVCKLNIPPAPFKGGDVTVSIYTSIKMGGDVIVNNLSESIKGSARKACNRVGSN